MKMEDTDLGRFSAEVYDISSATEWYINTIEKTGSITLTFLLWGLEVPLFSWEVQMSGIARGGKLVEISPPSFWVVRCNQAGQSAASYWSQLPKPEIYRAIEHIKNGKWQNPFLKPTKIQDSARGQRVRVVQRMFLQTGSNFTSSCPGKVNWWLLPAAERLWSLPALGAGKGG